MSGSGAKKDVKSGSGAKKDVKFSLEVTVNKQRTRVLFAKADSSFADVLLSFLTLPLGTIVRIFQKHYKDEVAAFGSLTTLYEGLSNLDSSKFWTQGAKSLLLHPRSSFDAQRQRLKLDISDSPPVEYFVCQVAGCSYKAERESVYYDNPCARVCPLCGKYNQLKKETKKRASEGGFTVSAASFLITDDLQIIPDMGLMQIFSVLGDTDMMNAELLTVTLGFSEVMDLLKASLISSTPLSDIILKNTTGQMNSLQKYGNPSTSYLMNLKLILQKSRNMKKMNVKLIVQKSTNKLLYAEAEDDFVEFLFGLLIFPLGKVESLLKSNSGIKAIDNLHSSVDEFMDGKYFKIANHMLMNPKIPHGSIPKSNILLSPHEAGRLDLYYNGELWTRSANFPKGKGNYLVEPQTYKVEDDLTVTPFCVTSVLSSLRKLEIPRSDIEEVPLQIGSEEGLSILKASLTSTCVLTDALLVNHVANKQPKPESRASSKIIFSCFLP